MRVSSPVGLSALVLVCAVVPVASSGAPLPPQTSSSRALIANQGLISPPGSDDFALSASPELFLGVARDRIPLALPPGRVGLGGEVALHYAPSGGSGILGHGWDLDLGRIERSSRRGIDFASDDYVLDDAGAAELVSIGGGEYRAKIEGQFRRVKKLSAADGRSSWEVTDRTGTRRVYGSTSAARQDDPADSSRIFAWHLERIEDVHGNHVSITYFKDRGAIYPDTMAYTGAPGLAAPVTVRFVRDAGTRPDAYRSYARGFAVTTAHLVKAIEIRASGAVVGAFAVQYAHGSASGRAVMSSLQRFGSDAVVDSSGSVTAGTGLPARSFGYSTGTPPTNVSLSGPALSAAASAVNVINPDLARVLYADFNGDGRTDLAYVDGFGSSRPIKIHLANGGGFAAPIDGPVRSVGTTTTAILNDVARIKIGDYNGDGRADLLTIDGATGSGTVAVYLANPDGTFPTQRSFSGPTVQVGTPDVDVSRITVGDFDGDGRTDILQVGGTSVAQPIRLHLSNGAGFEPAILGPQFAVLAGVSSLARIKLGDFNGDTRTDLAIVNGSGGAAAMAIYTLNAARTALVFLMNGPTRTIRADAEGARVDASRIMPADVNGDGRTDLLALEGLGTTAPLSIYFATGSGFTTRADGPSRFFSLTYPDQSIGRVRIGDYNGDGLADLAFVEGDNGSAPISIHLSTGVGYRAAVAGPTRSVSGGSALAHELLRVGTGDFDGDGRTDFLGNNSSGIAVATSLYLAQGMFPDLLWSISNGIGGTRTLAYRPAASFRNDQFPFPAQLVSSVTVDDGNGVVGTTTFSYDGGYYHVRERESRGFRRVDVTPPSGPNGEQAQTRHWFHQGDGAAIDVDDPAAQLGCTRGKPYRVQVWDLQASAYVETLTSYWPSTTAPCFAPPNEVITRHCETSGVSTTCGRTRTISYASFTGGQPAFGYDAYGNTLQENDFGDLATTHDDRTIVRTYSPNATKWIVALPSRETTYAGAGATTSLAPGNRIAETVFWYDGVVNATTCESVGAAATPTQGRRTKIVRWLNGGTSPEEWIGHDTYGNEICKSDPDRRVTRWGYDASKTFRTSETNAKGHVTAAQYFGVDGLTQDKGRYGQLKRVVDPNSAELAYEYDALGRRTKEVRPAVPGPAAGDPYAGSAVTFSYFLGGVGTNRVESSTSEGVWAADHFDGLGRTYLARRRGSSSAAARTFNARTQFNPTGTKARTSQPYFDGAVPRWTEYAYDAAGRIRATTQPDGTRILACYRDLDGSAAEVDANGHRKRLVRDARGNVISVQEYTESLSSCGTDVGSPYATTRYTYDQFARVTSITDAANTPYATGYDTLGRIRFESDPDLGTWYYGYSAAGDQTSIQDANGAAAVPPYSFAQTFDELHRITSRTYPQGVGLAWTYDDPAVPYSKGRLTRVTDASGETRLGYDAVGRTYSRTQVIDGKSYLTLTRFDAADRIVGETYPDAAATNATYQFDADGFLAKVVVDGAEHAVLDRYNAFGQLGRITSPAAVTAYGYDDSGNNRLKSVQVTARGATVLGLAYEYDPARQVKRIIDSVDPRYTFEYDYDALNRLTAARSSAYGALAYTYDRLGNLLTKEGLVFTAYDPIKVHAVRSTSDGRSYSYDSNGNLLGDGQRVLRYDFENRPISISAGGATTLVTYGHDGRRVKRQVTTVTSSSTTVYVGRLLECTQGACTRHVFAGEKRIASIEATGATRYYHPDHLDTTRATTDSAGFVGERIAYKPFGDGDGAGTSGTRYRYNSKELDRETGLYYYGGRYYDPTIGRFITPDPVAPPPHDPQSLNRYAYTRNNPASNRDPTGHAIETPWDAANVAMGVASFAANVGAGNWGGAVVDAIGILADSAATVAPGVPGGAASAIRAVRLADTGIDLVRAADKAADAARAADRAADAARAADRAADVAREGERALDAAADARKAVDSELGVVYKRTNPATGETYVGQAKSPRRFEARKAEHDRGLGVDHDYEILGRARPGKDLDVVEETMIRDHGGLQREGGSLANRRHQMSDQRYDAARNAQGPPPDPWNVTIW